MYGPGSDSQYGRSWHYADVSAALRPEGGNPNRGPDEGRTRYSRADPAVEIVNADPFADPDGAAWFADNRGWHTDSDGIVSGDIEGVNP